MQPLLLPLPQQHYFKSDTSATRWAEEPCLSEHPRCAHLHHLPGRPLWGFQRCPPAPRRAWAGARIYLPTLPCRLGMMQNCRFLGCFHDKQGWGRLARLREALGRKLCIAVLKTSAWIPPSSFLAVSLKSALTTFKCTWIIQNYVYPKSDRKLTLDGQTHDP